MAGSNEKFAAAVAAMPAQLSGVSSEGYAECIRKTQQARMPDRYAYAEDYAFYKNVMDELGESMLRQNRELINAAALQKRFDLG